MKVKLFTEKGGIRTIDKFNAERISVSREEVIITLKNDIEPSYHFKKENGWKMGDVEIIAVYDGEKPLFIYNNGGVFLYL